MLEPAPPTEGAQQAVHPTPKQELGHGARLAQLLVASVQPDAQLPQLPALLFQDPGLVVEPGEELRWPQRVRRRTRAHGLPLHAILTQRTGRQVAPPARPDRADVGL